MYVSRSKRLLLSFAILSLLCILWFVQRVIYTSPDNINSTIVESDLVKISTTHFSLNNSWIRLNKHGNWECYIEGNGYDRGRTLGILQKELGKQQEAIFMKEIDRQVPSWFFKKILTIGIAWFNRDLDSFIPKEYQEEIYGISQFFSDDFDAVGPKYNRIIDYHAAHDIGHAVQNMHLVGCTAFGIWNFDSTNQMMMIGRNFDFYFGDEFAKNKVVLLSNPNRGYKSISITWPSFVGVVSGINETGLGITLNSAKSEIPSESGTPVSIIARDILQYASTIDEAIVICDKYNSFVSESFTISSAIDQRVIVIEKTPKLTGIYTPETNSIIVTNHFQSEELKNSPLNVEHKNSSESVGRFNRTNELFSNIDSLDYLNFATILRDQKGFGNKDIGMGNPLSINQLLAHHTVIFNNIRKTIWVSAYPFQINYIDAYSLADFTKWPAGIVDFPITIDSLEIPKDPFFVSEDYNKFTRFKEIRNVINHPLDKSNELDEEIIDEFISTNSAYYEVYLLIGNYYLAIEDKEKALNFYKIALNKEIAYQEDREYLEAKIRDIKSND